MSAATRPDQGSELMSKSKPIVGPTGVKYPDPKTWPKGAGK